MLFWILGILNMAILFFVGGPAAALVGGCYTIVIYMVARIIVKNGCVPFRD